MKKRFTKWLQIKVFFGLGALVFGAAAFITYLNLLSQDNHVNQQLLSYVKQLEVQGLSIKRRGETYASNAPREYEPYFRDLVIFYPDFMQDLEAFENQIKLIASASAAQQNSSLPATDSLTSSISNLQQNWQVFKKGFLEKLGRDLKEPRLEWAADYVQENQALISQITGTLISTIEDNIQNQLNANDQLTDTAIKGSIFLLLAGIIWFYFSVIRRISQTINGCQRVAQGDFGYQLNTRGSDELSALASAFNTLSARTRFVVTMLSNMHNEGTANTKINTIWQEASGYLPIEWLGLWQLDSSTNTLRMQSMRSERTITDSLRNTLVKVTASDPHLFGILNSGIPTRYNNLPQQAGKLSNAKLMHEFIKMGLLNSVLIVPLKADNNWQGLLVFVAAEENAYSDEQLDLMQNLAPFLAKGFAH